MTNASEFIDATPSAALLIESIRDIGYSLETAIADLVDNSISAGAKNIKILLINDSDNQPFLSVEDDGEGMSEEELFLIDMLVFLILRMEWVTYLYRI